MEFYKIWQTKSGMIGVNKLSLGDLLFGVPIVMLIVATIFIALLAPILPSILFLIYFIWMVTSDHTNQLEIKQRLFINVLTIITVIYYLVDFHYGWVSFSILGTVVGVEGMNGLARWNLSVGVINLLFFLLGHEIFYNIKKFKVLLFMLFISLMMFYLRTPTEYIVRDVIGQSTQDFTIGLRSDGYVDDSITDEERAIEVNERKIKELEKEIEMKQYDIDYANGKDNRY